MSRLRDMTHHRPHPVWALNVAIAAAAVGLFLGPVAHLGPLARPHLAWWVIAPLFAAAELCVVHLHFRQGAHSFSLGEIPLVLGLVFGSGWDVVTACVLGSALVLVIGRRLPPVKLGFNLAQFTLVTCVATLVAHGFASSGAPLNPQTWFAVLLATQSASVVSALLIACAVYLSERELRLAMIARMFVTDGVVALNNTSLGLCATVILAIAPTALPLLVVPLGTLFIAYRAYLSELERQKQLDFMHEANRTLTGTGEIAGALERLLERSLQAFRAESAELILFGSDGEAPERMVLDARGRRPDPETIDAEVAERLRRLAADGGARLLGVHLDDPALEQSLGHAVVRHALLAPLRREGHLVGLLLLINRVGVGAGFDRDDLKLLETLAAHTTVALQNDRLEQAVAELSRAHDDLHREANHDPLTGLVNRRAFTEQVTLALAQDPLAVALLFIDLDNFKGVNDTLGHAQGDRLLMTIAARLRGCVRGDDVVARLGGDEFAVLVRAPEIIETAAVSVAERIVESCRVEVRDEGMTVPVHASVGIAVCRAPDTSAQALIHAADMAMYKAKKGGKGRFEVSESPFVVPDLPTGGAVRQ